MAIGVSTTFPNGKLRISPSGRAVLSTEEGPCCCKCTTRFPPDCTDSPGCVLISPGGLVPAVCCAQCGDTIEVDLGTFTRTGTDTEWAIPADALAALSSTTITAIFGNRAISEGYYTWYSDIVGSDSTYVYALRIDVGYGIPSAFSGLGSAVLWLVDFYFLRAPIADLYTLKYCNFEPPFLACVTNTCFDSDPECPYIGDCCGFDGERPVLSTIGYFSDITPITRIQKPTGCRPFCACDELETSYLVEGSCVDLVVNGTGNCQFSGNSSTGTGCDLVEIGVSLYASSGGDEEDFCGWYLQVVIQRYELVGEDCFPLDTEVYDAQKAGGGPTGTYTITSSVGPGCGTEIEVS
jgi:hypothetical protein